MPDQYGRKALDEAIAAGYEVRYRAEEEARTRLLKAADDLERDARRVILVVKILMPILLVFLVGMLLVIIFWP